MKIPVLSVTKADGARLRANPGAATIKLNAGVRVERTHNVIAQTKTGSTHERGDGGRAPRQRARTGRASTTTARASAASAGNRCAAGQFAASEERRAVRLLGGRGRGLIGSTKYVQTLDVDALKDIALYLNFDMLASPNPGYFTYDGDQSAPAGHQRRASVPEGSAGIERTLVAYLKGAGKPAEDYRVRRPLGLRRLHPGRDPGRRPVLRRRGQDDRPSRPSCGAGRPTSRSTRTTTSNRHARPLDRTALGIQGGGVAYAIGLYAQDQGGRNGVPIRDDRTRHVLRLMRAVAARIADCD